MKVQTQKVLRLHLVCGVAEKICIFMFDKLPTFSQDNLIALHVTSYGPLSVNDDVLLYEKARRDKVHLKDSTMAG